MNYYLRITLLIKFMFFVVLAAKDYGFLPNLPFVSKFDIMLFIVHVLDNFINKM